MQTMADRIQLKMQERGCKQIDIINATGAKKGTVSKWVSGVNKPKGVFLLKLASFLDVDADWLLTGELDISKDDKPNNDLKDVNFVDGWDESTPPNDDEIEIFHYEKVVGLTENKEGCVHIATEKKVRISKNLAKKAGADVNYCFSYINDSDSMAERIAYGARCTADASKTEIKEGKIYCFKHGITRRTKYLSYLPNGGLLIKSHNSNYADEIIEPKDVHSIEVLGWVWEWSNTEQW